MADVQQEIGGGAGGSVGQNMEGSQGRIVHTVRLGNNVPWPVDTTLTHPGEAADAAATGAAIGAVASDVEAAEAEIAGLAATVIGHGTSISALDTRVGAAEESVEAIGGRVTTAEADIDALQERADSAETAIDDLDGRTEAVEADVEAIQSRLDTDETAIDGLGTRMDAAETDISGLGTRVTEAEGDIIGLDTRLTEAEGEISGLDTRIGAAEEAVEGLGDRMDAAEAEIEEKLGADAIADDLETDDPEKVLSAAQGVVLKGLTDDLQDGKIDRDDIADDLETDDSEKVLSAAQGVVLESSKLDKTSVYDGLDSADSELALSAAMGQYLYTLIGNIVSATVNRYGNNVERDTTVYRLGRIRIISVSTKVNANPVVGTQNNWYPVYTLSGVDLPRNGGAYFLGINNSKVKNMFIRKETGATTATLEVQGLEGSTSTTTISLSFYLVYVSDSL